MEITYFDSKSEMSEFAAQRFYTELKQNPDLLFCAVTGNSPKELYALLAEKAKQTPDLFDELRVLQLDEWGGISRDSPHSCFSYLKTHVLHPLNISPDQFIGFDSSTANPDQECSRVQRLIDQDGPIGLCVLGLGTNGHLGFNEPATALHAMCHKAELDPKTQQHSMVQSMDEKPSFGMTVGMKDILQSKKIWILITGEGKEKVIKQLLKSRVSSQLPASFLWLHSDVECFIDRTCFSNE